MVWYGIVWRLKNLVQSSQHTAQSTFHHPQEITLPPSQSSPAANSSNQVSDPTTLNDSVNTIDEFSQTILSKTHNFNWYILTTQQMHQG